MELLKLFIFIFVPIILLTLISFVTVKLLLTIILLTSKSPETFNPILVFHLSLLYLKVATLLISMPASYKSDLCCALIPKFILITIDN